MLDTLYTLVKDAYLEAEKRILFLDYDGTLVPFNQFPEEALPDEEILRLIKDISLVKQNTVVIISGRDRVFLDKVFGEMDVTLVAEHGFFIRRPGSPWKAKSIVDDGWKNMVMPGLLRYLQLFPGSMVEEKTSSLVWHYRSSDIVPTEIQINDLKTLISNMLVKFNLEVLDGNKVVEVKEKAINKGTAAMRLVEEIRPGFILAAGDDVTDEFLFKALPGDAFTIKVGQGETSAKYCCFRMEDVANLLLDILK